MLAGCFFVYPHPHPHAQTHAHNWPQKTTQAIAPKRRVDTKKSTWMFKTQHAHTTDLMHTDTNTYTKTHTQYVCNKQTTNQHSLRRRRRRRCGPPVGRTCLPAPWCLPAPTNLDAVVSGLTPWAYPAQHHRRGSPLRPSPWTPDPRNTPVVRVAGTIQAPWRGAWREPAQLPAGGQPPKARGHTHTGVIP